MISQLQNDSYAITVAPGVAGREFILELPLADCHRAQLFAFSLTGTPGVRIESEIILPDQGVVGPIDQDFEWSWRGPGRVRSRLLAPTTSTSTITLQGTPSCQQFIRGRKTVVITGPSVLIPRRASQWWEMTGGGTIQFADPIGPIGPPTTSAVGEYSPVPGGADRASLAAGAPATLVFAFGD